MLREAVPADAVALEAFLARHAASSMFLRGNLEAHGTQERQHRRGTTYLIKEDAGAICAVAGCTNAGYLMCQAPDQDAAFWEEVCWSLEGRSVAGITGVPDQTAAWAKALGAGAEDYSLNDIEPLYQLDLADVAAVDPDLSLRLPLADDLAMLTRWYDGFHRDTGITPGSGMTNEGVARDFIDNPDGRVLVAGGQPVAMTKLNARAVDSVQIGGVYVPPDQRGHGYGGAVVALHLAALARQDVQQAVLFAANAYAAQAYERIGFCRVGEYRVALFKEPVIVGAARVGTSSKER